MIEKRDEVDIKELTAVKSTSKEFQQNEKSKLKFEDQSHVKVKINRYFFEYDKWLIKNTIVLIIPIIFKIISFVFMRSNIAELVNLENVHAQTSSIFIDYNILSVSFLESCIWQDHATIDNEDAINYFRMKIREIKDQSLPALINSKDLRFGLMTDKYNKYFFKETPCEQEIFTNSVWNCKKEFKTILSFPIYQTLSVVSVYLETMMEVCATQEPTPKNLEAIFNSKEVRNLYSLLGPYFIQIFRWLQLQIDSSLQDLSSKIQQKMTLYRLLAPLMFALPMLILLAFSGSDLLRTETMYTKFLDPIPIEYFYDQLRPSAFYRIWIRVKK